MKYVAFPINKEKDKIKSDDHEHLLRMAKEALIYDPAIRGYHIMEHIATLTPNVSVSVVQHNDVGRKQNNGESLFDPKPDGIPNPPEGFVYYGVKRVLAEPAQKRSDDIAFLEQASGNWLIGSFGTATMTYYAIRRSSPTFLNAVELEKRTKRFIKLT